MEKLNYHSFTYKFLYDLVLSNAKPMSEEDIIKYVKRLHISKYNYVVFKTVRADRKYIFMLMDGLAFHQMNRYTAFGGKAIGKTGWIYWVNYTNEVVYAQYLSEHYNHFTYKLDKIYTNNTIPKPYKHTDPDGKLIILNRIKERGY